MSNKKQLQQHNADLVTALDNINGLPQAEDVKHGQYVWEKYAYTPPLTITNPEFDAHIGGRRTELKLENANFDTSKIEDHVSFFTGFKKSDENTARDNFHMNGERLVFTYPANSSIALLINDYSKELGTLKLGDYYLEDYGYVSFIYRGTKTIARDVKVFERFAVSDNPNKYPDDGEQGGYYYKKVKRDCVSGLILTDLNSNKQPEKIIFRLPENMSMESLPQIYSNSYIGTHYTDYCKEVLVDIPIINKTLRYYLYYFAGKIKFSRNCTQITVDAFDYVGTVDTYYIPPKKRACFLPSTLTRVDTVIDSECNTNNYPNQRWTIYCESTSRPSGWNSNFHQDHYADQYHTVIWGVTEEQFDAL